MKNNFLFIVMLTAMSCMTVQAEAQTKSRAGKDALIGAGAGALTGVAVSKHKGKGAFIGGAAGAVGGYAYGKHQDKKKGRKIVRKHH
ncbi:MAG: glycine zipper domain-containing protein [Ferruginibacter sp.]